MSEKKDRGIDNSYTRFCVNCKVFYRFKEGLTGNPGPISILTKKGCFECYYSHFKGGPKKPKFEPIPRTENGLRRESDKTIFSGDCKHG